MTKDAHWTQIEQALGDEKAGYTYLDTPEECWFAVQDRGLRGWSRGELLLEVAEEPGSAPVARHVFHHLDEECFVELTEYPEGARRVCAVDNGALFQTELDPAAIPELCAHYERLGFRRVNPWNLAEDTILWREYRVPTDRKQKVVVSVDGTTCHAEESRECATREEAEALAEAQVVALHARGFRLRLMEQWEASESNPPVASAPPAPELRAYPEPSSAREAVDQAVARLTELHRALPKAHFVLEALSLPDEQGRLAELGHEHFTTWYPDMLGRWLASADADVEGATSSYDYFRRRYGSLTWIVRSGSPRELSTFYCGNVSGGGLSPLQIRDQDYGYLEELADAHDEPAYLKLNVFHGGWHDGLSYAFDTRFTSPEGEHPIVDFDECEAPSMLSEAPAEIQPFGFWLLERVKELSAVVVPWVSRFQLAAAT